MSASGPGRPPARTRPGWPRLVLRGIVILLVNAVGVLVAAAILPGVEVAGRGAIVGALLIALVNAALWPTLARLLLPVSALTLGLGSLAGTGAMIWLAGQITSDFRVDSLGAGVLMAFVLTVVNVAVTTLLGIDDDAYYWRHVVRRAAGREAAAPTGVPGVLFLEIDGLGHDVLRRALRNGLVPTMARWLADGSHRLMGWECDWSSQTGASQAGLLHGNNRNMPAFRWHEKDRGVTLVSNRPRDTAAIQARISDGRGLLFGDGVSRANMFTGDAPHTLLTLSNVTQRGRGRVGHDYYAYFANPASLTRTIVLGLVDVVREKWAYLDVRRRDARPWVRRGGLYPLMRAFTTVVQRDLAVQTLISDVYAGRPVGYATFVGYDEVAHHSGIERPETLRALGQLDRQFGRLAAAADEASRPYRLVILSDHGQTDGTPFRQLHGETLEDLVDRLTVRAGVEGSGQGDEGWAMLSASVTEASQSTGAAGRGLRRATRGKQRDGAVDLGPEARERRDDVTRDPAPTDILVMASGCLGLVYLTREPGRVSLERLAEVHPELVPGLREHPGIGFLLVRSERHGSLVLGPRGQVVLETGAVEGEDPLAAYGPNALRHVRRTDGFTNVADIMINAAYDPELGVVPAFEEFVGSHGGLGGAQSLPFALVPADWAAPQGPVVGAEAMHRLMRRWLADLGHEGYRPPATGGSAGGGATSTAMSSFGR